MELFNQFVLYITSLYLDSVCLYHLNYKFICNLIRHVWSSYLLDISLNVSSTETWKIVLLLSRAFNKWSLSCWIVLSAGFCLIIHLIGQKDICKSPSIILCLSISLQFYQFFFVYFNVCNFMHTHLESCL